MDLSITQVPLWLSFLFVACFSTFPVFLIANAAKEAYQKENTQNASIIRKKIILFYWLYLAIVAAVSLTGFFMENVLPPRIILFTAVPLFLFYLFYVQRTEWFQVAFKYIKVEDLIFIHLFRFVGIFFFLVYQYDAIPKAFAFIGGTGDIVSAVLVIPVVIALKKGLPKAKLFAWVWNIIGLLDIVSVLSSAIILTRMATVNNTSGVQQFGTFPFSWIPAFAPATIIFLHILIFKKLKQQ
ncbi:MAG: hypothetical protein AB8F74_04375 [Saprospiraceae bacterium]